MLRLIGPEIAPLSFAGALIGLFAGARDSPVFNLALRCAQRQLNVAAVLSRMADNT